MSTSIDPLAMRLAMSQFATGVTVVTTVAPTGDPAGCTVSAFSSLSLDPPLVLVCIGQERSIHAVLRDGPGFAVNILTVEQRAVAYSFAKGDHDRFAATASLDGRHGIPLIQDALAHIQCDLHALLDGGDHTIVVGRVRQVDLGEGEPLIYHHGNFLDFPTSDWERAAATAAPEWLLSAPW